MAKNQALADMVKMIKFRSNLNQSEISAKIGVSKQYLSDTLNGRYPFTDDLRRKLYEQFTYLRDAFEGNSVENQDGEKDVIQMIADNGKSDGSVKAKDKYRLVPLINIDSVGGMHSDNAISDEPQYIIDLIPFVGAYEDDICITESGNSMAPTIPPGSLLLLRNVPEWREYFGFGSIFVIELKDGRRITKEVRRSEENAKLNVLCHSHNDSVSDEELPKSMIVSVWKVVKVLTNLGF